MGNLNEFSTSLQIIYSLERMQSFEKCKRSESILELKFINQIIQFVSSFLEKILSTKMFQILIK